MTIKIDRFKFIRNNGVEIKKLKQMIYAKETNGQTELKEPAHRKKEKKLYATNLSVIRSIV